MKPIEERINEFVEHERTGFAIDIRTLKDAETALLHWSDAFEGHWEDCEVDLHVTVAHLRDIRNRLAAFDWRKDREGGCDGED